MMRICLSIKTGHRGLKFRWNGNGVEIIGNTGG
jgi:hypothetical protein